jgi:cobalt/nickel transport system ATP-binding protein
MTTPAIRLTDVDYSYHDGTKALSGISIDIAPGEKVGIVGPNGSGKSTLLMLLNGVLSTSKGHVEIDGVKVNKKSLREIRRKVGVVFQNPDDQLFSPTVVEDVAFGPRNMGLSDEEIDERVDFALRLVGMENFKDRSAHHLSFGQKKRVAVATVLSMRPQIWAFDEPSSNLDPRTKHAVEEFINSLSDTVITVTQDMFFAAQTCSRIIVLYEGRIERDGPIEQIFSDDKLLEKCNLDFKRNYSVLEKLRG